MDANERESSTPEETDPLRAYAHQNAAKEVKPKSSVPAFLISVLVTAVILAIAFYLWGR
jgi:uncharacterized protein HemX